MHVAGIDEFLTKSHLDSFSFRVQRHLDVLSEFVLIQQLKIAVEILGQQVADLDRFGVDRTSKHLSLGDVFSRLI